MTRPLAIGWFPRVLLVGLLMSVTMGGMRPMVSYRALSLDAGPGEVGLISACFGILSLVIAVPAGRWIDRIGEAAFIVAGMIVIAIVGLVLVVSESLAVLAIAMLALGAGQIVALVAIQTLIANGGSAAGRDARFGAQTVIVSFGQLIGPAAAGFIVAAAAGGSGAGPDELPGHATDGVFALGAAIALAAGGLAVSLWRWPPAEHARTGLVDDGSAGTETALGAVRRVLRVPSIPQAMLASLTVLSCVDILTVYLPLYGEANAIPVTTVGLLLAVRGGASIAARAAMLPLRDRLGRRRLLIASMLLPAAMLVLLPLAGGSVPMLAAAVAAIGFGLGLGQPLTMTWVAGQAPVEIRGTALGVRLSANRFGQFAVPAAAGLVAGAAGLTLIFWSLGALLAASAGLVTRAAFATPSPGQDRIVETTADP